MISDKSTTPEHIKSLIKTTYKKKDPQLLEKVIYALILLENLAKNKLDFVFKGGTSLILILNRISRFSIDIDIIVPLTKREDFSKIFNKIIAETMFTKWEEQKRKDKGIPKEHFKWFYNPKVGSITETYILLDILYEEHEYPKTEKLKINSNVLVTEKSADDDIVVVPCINSILGDKLTAYAPNTTGVPYNVEKELEIIKQLFDVADLFDGFTSIETVSKSFHKLAEIELSYRELEKKPIDVLEDVIKTSLILCRRGKLESEKFKELEKGILALKGFVINKNFTIDHAIVCASKAAYLAAILLKESKTVERFDKKNLDGLKIETSAGNALNKLSKSNPEAFFYWCHTFNLIGDRF